MASSLAVACVSSESDSNSGARTSSAQSSVCSTMTPSRTRSTARVIRVRTETVTSGHPVGLLERVAEQDVGLEPGLVRLEVVALVEEQRVDLLGRHELLDRDLLGRPRSEGS